MMNRYKIPDIHIFDLFFLKTYSIVTSNRKQHISFGNVFFLSFLKNVMRHGVIFIASSQTMKNVEGPPIFFVLFFWGAQNM